MTFQSSEIKNTCSNISARRIKSIQKARLARAQCLAPDLFSDPAWDILLELLAAELCQLRIPTSALGLESGVPPTTTLRWITLLEERGLIVRQPDPLDAQRVFVTLSAVGLAGMSQTFNSTGKSENLL